MNMFLKRIAAVCLVLLSIALKSQTPTFTITNLSPSYSITCTHPAVNLTAASNHTAGIIIYSWAGPGSTMSGTNVSLSVPGVYTVTAYASPSVSSSQTLSIGINTISPTSIHSPTFQNITCSPTSVTNFSAATNVPVDHYWISPVGGTMIAVSSNTSIYTPGGPGTYTHVATNPLNGCTVLKTLTVASNSGFPTFSLTSPENFTLGCKSTSIIAVYLTYANTVPIPGGALSYTLLAPGSSTSLSSPLSTISAYTLNTGGTYTAVVMDNTNLCQTRVPFTVIQHTVGPVVSLAASSPTVCSGSIVLLSAHGADSYNFSPGVVNGSVMPVYNTTYSVIGTNTVTKCESLPAVVFVSVVALPSLSVIASNTVVCVGNTVSLSGMGAHTFTWSGSVISGHPFTPSVTTTYTLSGTNSLTGCENHIVYTVVVKPPLTVGSSEQFFCAGMSATLTALGAMSYTWNGGINSQTLAVNPASTTVYSVSGITSAGCVSSGIFTLQVNNSTSFSYSLAGMSASLSLNGIGCNSFLWDFGNGATNTLNPNPVVTYTSPGVYGVCLKCNGLPNACARCFNISVPGNAIGGVGIEEIKINSPVKIYPNPSNGYLNVELDVQSENNRIVFFNYLGQSVGEQILSPGKNAVLLDLPKGLYYYRVLDGNSAVDSGQLIIE